MIEQLILVRHGETVHNVAGIAQGWNDSTLSDRGEQQVSRLAERLRALDFDTVYSSPLGRALATAEKIARPRDLPIATDDDLREMSYGRWEGRSFLDVRREDEQSYQNWITRGDAGCPEGESHDDVRARLERAFARISAESRRPVVVSHGTAIRIAATALLGLPVMTARHFAQDNASMSVFLWRIDRWVLKSWNDVTHCS
ncbi:MAG: histidine phosphatase family protein [Thermoanaerobaculia bacterium]